MLFFCRFLEIHPELFGEDYYVDKQHGIPNKSTREIKKEDNVDTDMAIKKENADESLQESSSRTHAIKVEKNEFQMSTDNDDVLEPSI